MDYFLHIAIVCASHGITCCSVTFRDILRSVKEGMKSFKEKRAPTIHGGKEQILRSETDRMQDFKANVDNTWKWVRVSI